MTKLESQIKDLTNALKRLKEGLSLPKNVVINQDATIQRFEFTFELSWKTMQTIVNQNIQGVYGPKSVFREAAKLGLIDDPVKWFEFLDNRNQTVHTYKEDVAQKVYQSAAEFVPYVENFLENITRYLQSTTNQ